MPLPEVPGPQPPSGPSRPSRLAGYVTLASGMVVLGGRVTGIAVLEQLIPGLPAIDPSAALSFVAAGAALALHVGQRRSRHAVRLARLCAAFVVLVGAVELLSIVAPWDLGIDRILPGSSPDADPGRLDRMAPNTALNLVFVGTALLLLKATHRWRALFDTCLLLSGVISLTGVLGYAYRADALDARGVFIPMALNTALTFLVLATGIAFARPVSGWTAVATQNSLGGMMLRRLLPPSLLGVAFLGWLRLEGQRAGLYSGEVGIAMFSSAMIAALIVLIVSTANYLHEAEVRQRAAEAGAQDSMARLAAIVESSNDAIMSSDLRGTICTWNPAAERIYGYSADEVIGRSATLLVPPEDGHEILEIVHRTAGGERIADRDALRVRKDGTEIEVSLTVSPVHGAGGHVTGVSVIARDITDRKQQEEAIRDKRWLAGVGATALGVRHEINNPLATLLTSAALLDMGSNTPEEEREMVQTIAGEARRIRDVLLRLSDIQELQVVEVAGSKILDLSRT